MTNYDEDDFYSQSNLSTIDENRVPNEGKNRSNDSEDLEESYNKNLSKVGIPEDALVEGELSGSSKDIDDTEVLAPGYEGYSDYDEDGNLIEPKTYSINLGGVDISSFVVEDEDSSENKTKESKSGSTTFVVEGSDDDDVLSPEERLRLFADTILANAVSESDMSKYALDKLIQVASPQLFRDENYILFSVFYAYRGKLNRIRIDEEFLKLFLNRNRKLLQKSRSYIDIDAYGEVDGSVELAYIGGVISHFRRLRTLPISTVTEFETVFEKYLIEFKSIESNKAYIRAQVILTEGLKLGRNSLFGYEDSVNYLKRRLSEIEGLTEQNKGSGFVQMRDLLLEEKEVNKPYMVSDFGRLTALNKAYGGVYTGMFYQVIAPPKAGKTKFCVRVVHTALVKFGTNVTVWAHEGGMEAFTAQLRAVHFDYTYNTGKRIEEKKFGVDPDVILKDNYPNEEIKSLEFSSKLDLASNPSYGSVDYIDKPFEVETFIEDIETSVRSNHSTLVVIDYLQLLGSANNLSERESVSRGYKKLLSWCKTNNIAILSPGQYKQEAFDKLVEAGGNTSIDMRTSGGTSAEVLRTPDVIFAFWATTEDIKNNRMKILSMPCRFNRAFPEINAITDYSICQFISVDEE